MLPQASPALGEEQQRIRQDLDELRRRMLELARQYGPMSETRMGWFERAHVLEDLVASIAQNGRPVSYLTWRITVRDEP